MKILLNQQGFANIILSDTTVSGEGATDAVDTDSATTSDISSLEKQIQESGEESSASDTLNADELTEDVTTDTQMEEGAAEGEMTEGTAEGEMTEGITADEGMMMDGDYTGGDMTGMEGETTQSNGSVMSSWPFVISISAVSLALSVVIGILLAKKRIKKGFDLYED